ncbi:MAG: bifunctional phosphoribosylaminoimidazolecarboxamide formyltransferase/IMP cyclohydrolase [Firmicutes bacterium]|nr:bifunctional phosphoribosylaminoimidazolecarboxamide formyltransferase/IMP cyclohydrolase [Alicyclobacillaceae bacterium]MCL6497908.1 bifunctional phosphoribosylaminoimidazolecarboxamide formyltransferase/IMP cyclohydrolase [Bacillota bacterium]
MAEQRWALFSVHDKAGIVEVARWARSAGLNLAASGGTARHLEAAGLAVEPLERWTGFSELLGGRVKTLHPRIYAGLLSREDERDRADRLQVEAPRIALVVVNLYPFEARWETGADLDQLVEEIDIGGVSLIRAAAKNWRNVLVATDPAQYPALMARPLDAWSDAERLAWATSAFYHMAYYDAVIARALSRWSPVAPYPRYWAMPGGRGQPLRYGENPHQSAVLYTVPGEAGVATAELVQGKPLSYNNLADAEVAWRLVTELPLVSAVAVKHQTPCAAAVASTPAEAFQRARDADPVSIFGGIVAFNAPVDEAAARRLVDLFLEVVVGPQFQPEALRVLEQKPNLRVLQATAGAPAEEVRRISGGLLVQAADRFDVDPARFRRVAGPEVPQAMALDIALAWKAAAFVKSNAVVVVRDGVTRGIGGGQTNRIDAARQALERAGSYAQGAVLASDGFFPFGDVIEAARAAGIAVVVQPGGSVRDQESIDAAQAAGITLLFTDERHFRH